MNQTPFLICIPILKKNGRRDSQVLSVIVIPRASAPSVVVPRTQKGNKRRSAVRTSGVSRMHLVPSTKWPEKVFRF